MPDLSTKYLGLDLKNPVIAGSSGLTAGFDSIKEIAKQPVSAIVLKSLFEEDIYHEIHQHSDGSPSPYPKFSEFGGIRSRHNRMEEYLQLIDQCKKHLDIPVIASIHCITSFEWMPFAKRIEEAGADAIELNMFMLPSDPMRSSEENEQIYFDILTNIRRHVNFPVSVKIGNYFSGLSKMALKLSWTGIQGLVLFNRFFAPDIDVEKEELCQGDIFSKPEDYRLPLRWVGLLSDRVMCDISASSGIHTSDTVVKMLLAGAQTTQLTSAIYRNGPEVIGDIVAGLEAWMLRKNYASVKEFRGKLSLKKAVNPAEYERFQYLKYFNGEEL
jgi:dihydroorotate dehydrogenase (fumarate)